MTHAPEDGDDHAILVGDTWTWNGDTNDTIGPAELHEMGLCNSDECDWCGEEEDGD